jgi:lipooligosaccharide transport system permease protein
MATIVAPRTRPRPSGGLSGGTRVLEHDLAVYRRTWRGTAFSSFLQPILFLAAMGLGLGGLVASSGRTVGGVSYLDFLAPGLLAATAMQAAAGETTWRIMGGIKWDRTFEAMLATPLRVGDIVAGEIAYVTIRLATVTSIFFVVILAFGAVRSPLGILAVPAGVLTGLAFATPIIAFSASQSDDDGFNVLFRFVITPLFLFSGTFFPVEQLPAILQPVAWFTPLWHGVSLTRGLTLGTLDPGGAAVHVVVLATCFVAGTVAARRMLGRRLVK